MSENAGGGDDVDHIEPGRIGVNLHAPAGAGAARDAEDDCAVPVNLSFD
ncbi:MAG TPA: hypothetical protein VMX13_10715 [Sedimentisphaerales bacterium]|nr:hypothetical protein [Sedimentisphaerales bacterium]